MHHAVVVAPPRFEAPPSGNVFAAAAPVGPTCAALARGGHRVVLVHTTPDLEGDFDRALAGVGPGDDLLIYVAAATTTRAADAVALLIGDEAGTTLGLRVMSDAVLVREPASAIFVVEACHDGDPDDPMLAAEHVDAIVRAFDARARGYGVLVGVRPESRAEGGPWPFTRHWLAALDEAESRDDRGAAPMGLVYERMRAVGAVDASVQSFAFVRGRAEFVLAEPPGVIQVAAAMRSAPPAERSPPAPRPPAPSIPQMEPLLALADGARNRGNFDEALAGYKAALMVAPPTDVEGRAAIYASIGQMKLAQGKPREAELNFEKALASHGAHRASLDALVAIATDAKETRRAVEWRRKRLRALESDSERLDELIAIARSHEELGDARGAGEAYEEAQAIDRRRADVLEGLLAAYEKMQRWPRIVEVLSEIADACADDRERGAIRFEAADIALGRLRDEDRGIALLERALDDDPAHEQALTVLVAVRSHRGQWEAIDGVYARLVDRFAKLGDVQRAWDACRKLGALRRDKLRDVAGAIEAFTGAVRCKEGDVDSRAMLAEMHLARGDEPAAVAEFERIAQHAPTRVSAYQRLFSLHHRAGRNDRAWLAALALEQLEAADVDQQIFVDQYRPEGPVRPNRPLDDAAWDDLRAPGADDVVSGVLRAIVEAAAAARVEDLLDSRKLLPLDPSRRQSTTSTVTAVRSFQWAAQVLGVQAPDLYVLDAVPGGIAAVQAAVPSTALGPDVLRGLSAKEVAFLAARHLTYYRREHYALVHYPTLEELSALFLGAVKIAMPEVPVPSQLDEAVARLRKRLARHASDGDRENLSAAVERLDARDGRVDLAAWIKSVELTAQRAGLLLCGDLAVAMDRVRDESRSIAELSAEQKRGDLLAFSVSGTLARAREALSVQAAADTPPLSAQAG